MGHVVPRSAATAGGCPVRGRLRRPLAALLSGLAIVAAGAVSPAAASDGAAADEPGLYLVTLDGAGVAGYRGPLPDGIYRSVLRYTQDDALARVGSPAPVYRWTTALSGVAVALTATQADALRTDPRVALVERNAVRPIAGGAGPALGVPGGSAGRGGAGTVVGLVDTGIWPESPLFSGVPGLGPRPRDFRGGCATAPGWDGDACNRKLVGARWFVAGFGEDHVRSSSSLSPRDDSGHGTQMASIAAGNAGVSVTVPGQRAGRYGGVAPQARVAVYKACWTAPDPADDGCATADLVTAIDRATRDGVDVLNLSVGGPPEIDTVERALLGAAERDVVVVAAAGNAGRSAYAAHPSPWVTSVGGVTGDLRLGRVEPAGGPALTGAMASSRAVGPARLVVGADVAAAGSSRTAARLCRPGSLDASRVRGAVVLCERGGLGRVAKSAAVAQADGVGMVLANVAAGTVESDLHSVPTVHLDRAAARDLRGWHADHPAARVTLSPLGVRHLTPRMTPWSSAGDPTGTVVKPDVVAPAVGLLGAVPPGVRPTRWDFVSGTSAATAWTSGLALRLRARHDWPADLVRSALATTAVSVAGASALDEGAGRASATRSARPGLGYGVDPGAYREWLDGSLEADELNPPSILMTEDGTARRTVTNVTGRRLYFSSHATGFRTHGVTVMPAAVRLGPGEQATFRVSVSGPAGTHALDHGWVTWRSAAGHRIRIPVVLAR